MKTIVFKLVSCLILLNLTSCKSTKNELERPKVTQDGEIELLKSAPLPVLAWNGIPSDKETTKARYDELIDAGINHNLSFFMNHDEVQKALDVAAESGVKIIASCPQLISNPEETVAKFKDHPALAGYYLQDEPGANDFAELRDLVNRIKAVDNKHFCYINLLPNYAEWWWTHTETYEQYIAAFSEQVPVQLYSFDHYPITSDGLRENFYSNLELIAKTAKEDKKPFWAFALAVEHYIYPKPSIPQLKLQIYSNLAYGAQGIQYFTYWTPSDPSFEWTNAPITKEGTKTETYDMLKEVNQELHNLSPVFVGSKVQWVRHTGAFIPTGTERLDLLPPAIKSLTTEGLGAVVSYLKKEDQSYLVIVNRDYQQSMQVKISADIKVKRVRKNGSITEDVENTFGVEPGDAVIYIWNG